MKFGFVCRIYFETASQRRDIDPAFSGCPLECPNSEKYFDLNRYRKCDECPHKIARDDFKLKTVDLIGDFLGEKKAEKFRFDKFEQTLFTIINLEDLPKEKMSVKTHKLLSAYLSEKWRFERIEELQNNNQAKT